ncbi:MAG TPA: hypothetical protein VKY74_09225 [Chloroflexia bacterium]|nr:hypothetical protein [Chloroflexia bacterium]
MIGTWLRHWRERRRPRGPTPPGRGTDSARGAERAPDGWTAASTAPAGPAWHWPSPVPAVDPRLEVYLHQIADLPESDRAIIMTVVRQILDEESAYAQRIGAP